MLKNRLVYAAFLVASFVYVYFNGGVVPHLLLQAAIVVPLVSFVYMLLCFLSVSYTDSSKNRVIVKNDVTTFHFCITNKGVLFVPYVKMKLRFDQTSFSGIEREYVVSLMPLRKNDCTGIVKCKLAGKFACGFDSLEVIDLLGIFRLRRKVNAGFTLTVMPRVIQEENLPSQEDGGFNAKLARYRVETDPVTISDIRKYAAGDSFRSIHWKLSAKKRELLVKTHDAVTGTPTVVLLDFFPGNIPTEQHYVKRDSVLEYAAAVIHYCLDEELLVRVSYFNNDRRVDYPLGSRDDFQAVVSEMAAVNFDAQVSVKDVLKEMLSSGAPVQNLIVISADNSPSMMSLVRRMEQIGCSAYFYDANLPIDNDGKVDAKTSAMAS